MRNDCSPIYSGSCKCGAGEEEIEFCTPDHGWSVSVSQWYETAVKCPKCDKGYKIQRFGKHFHRVSTAEIEAKEIQKQKAYETSKVISKKAQEKGVKQALIKLLTEQPSIAATYRMLLHAELVHCSLGTFRKNWPGSQSWADQNSRGHNVTEIMSLLGIEDEGLKSLHDEMELSLAEAHKAPTPMGEPVYTLK
jgi:hypothetical protein